MNKVFVLAPGEDWIVDRFVKEWSEDNTDITTSDLRQADVIWLMADWCWSKIPTAYLATKKVLTTIHHLVPDKFSTREEQEFRLRDQFTTAYHVPNKYTEEMVRFLTKKPVHVIPYWANQKIWHPTNTRMMMRAKYDLPQDAYIIGSFQRDTEGKDLISPKLEKGPDLLADAIIKYRDKSAHAFQVHVVLAGWRRQYLIGRLNAAGVPHTYFEKPTQDVVNELYQCLNLYPVTARFEGGPQSLIECGLHGVPVVSRHVGMAHQVLPESAINNDVTLATPCVPDVGNLVLPRGYEPYRRLIESL